MRNTGENWEQIVWTPLQNFHKLKKYENTPTRLQPFSLATFIPCQSMNWLPIQFYVYFWITQRNISPHWLWNKSSINSAAILSNKLFMNGGRENYYGKFLIRSVFKWKNNMKRQLLTENLEFQFRKAMLKFTFVWLFLASLWGIHTYIQFIWKGSDILSLSRHFLHISPFEIDSEITFSDLLMLKVDFHYMLSNGEEKYESRLEVKESQSCLLTSVLLPFHNMYISQT